MIKSDSNWLRTVALVLLIGGLVLSPIVQSNKHAMASASSNELTAESEDLADISLELLVAISNEAIDEAEEGEADEALELIDRFEGVLENVAPFLVASAGDVAKEELAEIEEFIPRLRSSLEADEMEKSVDVASLIRDELQEISSAAGGEAGSAEAALAKIDRILNTIIHEVKEEEFDEAYTFVERWEGLVEANRGLLVEAAGELAEKELAEVEEFAERIETAIEEENVDSAIQALELVREEFSEIGEGLKEKGAAGPRAFLSSVETAPSEEAPTVLLEISELPVPLGAYDLTISYDPVDVQLEDTTVTYGTALPSPQIDREAGRIQIQGVKPQDPKKGKISIAELTFKAIGDSGQSAQLDLEINELSGPDGQEIEVTTQPGKVNIK